MRISDRVDWFNSQPSSYRNKENKDGERYRKINHKERLNNYEDDLDEDFDVTFYSANVTADPGAVGTVNIASESVETGQEQNIEADTGVAFTLDVSITIGTVNFDSTRS